MSHITKSFLNTAGTLFCSDVELQNIYVLYTKKERQ